MPQMLLILVFVVVHLADLAGEPGGTVSERDALQSLSLSTLPFLLLIGVTHAAIWACGRIVDRTGSWRSAQLAERIAIWSRFAAVLVHAGNVYFLQILQAVRVLVGNAIVLDELIVVLPVLLSWTASWWSIEPIDRRLREAALLRHIDHGLTVYPLLSRSSYVWMSFRHGVLTLLVPMLAIMSWGEIVDRFAAARQWADSSSPSPDPRTPLLQLVGVAAVFVLMPPVLRRLWDTVRLGEGELRSRLLDMCRSCGAGVRELLVWRTNGLLVNGAAVGVLRPLRYIMLTDALLDRLAPPQIEAVAAHEMGHIRRRHMIWLATIMLASFTTMIAGVEALQGAMIWLKVPLPDLTEDQSHTVVNVLSAGMLALGLVVFGFVSRRFEWQADAFAVQCLSGAWQSGAKRPAPVPISAPAVEAMTSALGAVSALAGVPRRRFAWRHGSIASRQRKLHALLGTNANELPIDRSVTRIKWTAITLGGAATAYLAHVSLTAPAGPPSSREPNTIRPHTRIQQRDPVAGAISPAPALVGQPVEVARRAD